MRLLVTTEERFWQSGGHIWVQGPTRYSFWTRYLDVFDEVLVMGRVLPVERMDPQWQQVDGDRVSVASLPHYIGPWQYLLRHYDLGRAIQDAAESADAYILRVPSQLATRLVPVIHAMGRPYGLEVVGDPWGVFARGAVTHPLSPFFRWWFVRNLEKQCRNACAISYVTRRLLQRRYIPGQHAFITHYSSIDLNQEAFSPAPRPAPTRDPITMVSVLSFAQMYKAPDVMIRALARLIGQGRRLRLVLVGDGHYLEAMRELAASLGVSGAVEFRGRLPSGAEVRTELDKADLFLLPSRTEGLPRAMIEAMARALPCIGSSAGGIPELLPPEDMVPVGDDAALADKIAEFIDHPERMELASARNLKGAAEYRDDVLRRRRNEFYRRVRYETESCFDGNEDLP